MLSLSNSYVSICVRTKRTVHTLKHVSVSGVVVVDAFVILCLRSPFFGQANIIKYFQVDIVVPPHRTMASPQTFQCVGACVRVWLVDFR